MSYTRYFRRASRAAYAMDFPRVAHIVADLDDLALGVPYRGPRRPSLWGRLTAVVRRVFAHRRLAAVSAMTAIVMAVAACGDSTEPVTPAPVAEVGVTGRGYAAVTATIDGLSSSTAITVTERDTQ